MHATHSRTSATEPFLRRIQLRSKLSASEEQAILALSGEHQRVPAHRDIVLAGAHVESACLVLKGIVGRFDQMLDGTRQVTSFYLAGDMCDLHSVVVPKATWSITALSDAVVLRVPHAQLIALCNQSPRIALAFWRDGTVDASIFSKWIGNLGRKSSIARLSHIFCEMGVRSEAAGLGHRMSYDLPITQSQIGDAAGITPVHVNRTLQEIRARSLLTFDRGRVIISDWVALSEIAEFDPDYLMSLS